MLSLDEDEMSRILLDHLAYVLTVDPQDRVLEDAAIVIEDDRIAAIGPAPAVAQQYRGASFDRVVDGRRRLAMPGLVDAHLHLSEELSGGLSAGYSVGSAIRRRRRAWRSCG